MLFLVGGPSQIDTWDPKPERPRRDPRPVQGHRHQRARHADQRNLPADGPARRQVFADPQRLPHGHGRPRHRPPDDADRPAVHRRRRASRTPAASWATSRAAAARCRPTSCFPSRSAAPAATCRTARRPATSASSYDPFVLNADPNDKNFNVPDLLPPDYISAVRAGRRQQMRDAVEGELAAFEKQAQAKQMDDNFNLAYRLMSSAAGPRGVRPGQGAGVGARPLRPHALRPELPAGAAADRARRALRDGQHVRDGLRRESPGTSTARGRSPTSRRWRSWSRRTSTRPTAPCWKTCRTAAC